GKGKTKLSHLQLSNNEWGLLEEIKPILQWFKIASKRVSASARPLLHTVIPIIDTLTDNLLKVCSDWSKSPQTRAGAAKAIAVLNKYYSKTDDSIMYKAAMIMHPRYKMKYFKDAKWEQSWINMAKTSTQEFFATHYLNKVEQQEAPSVTRAPQVFYSLFIIV
ncbi:hypothetical protein K435DRAFT_695561, partial [Dendrothele bispora CBS 962.96]